MTKFKVITFDAYSALLDIEGSMVPVLKKYFPDTTVDLLAFFKLWRMRQWDYVLLSENLEKGFHSYRYITRCALDYTLKKHKMTLSDDDCDALVSAWGNIKAWPEAQQVLKEVQKRGYEIAILSNGDNDMLEPLRKSTEINFEYIFGAEQAGHYKPHPAIYALPFDKLKLSHEEVIHIAGSPFDMMGAKSAGILCGWSNRLAEVSIDAKYQPDYEWANLSGVLEIL